MLEQLRLRLPTSVIKYIKSQRVGDETISLTTERLFGVLKEQMNDNQNKGGTTTV